MQHAAQVNQEHDGRLITSGDLLNSSKSSASGEASQPISQIRIKKNKNEVIAVKGEKAGKNKLRVNDSDGKDI